MKSLIVVLTILMLCVPVSAEDEKSTVTKHTEEVLNTLGEKANAAMDSVSERFGEPAEYAFEALSSYYYNLGYLCLVAALLSLAGVVFFYWRGSRFIKFSSLAVDAYRDKWDGKELTIKDRKAAREAIVSAGVFHYVIGTALLAPLAIATVNALDYLSGPERHAILEAKGLLGL